MPVIGATLAAMFCGWVVDDVVQSFAPLWARVLVGFVVSTLAYYRALLFLREMRGR